MISQRNIKELKKMWKVNAKAIPVITGAFGTV